MRPGYATLLHLSADEVDAWLAGLRDSLVRVETPAGPRYQLPVLGRFRLPRLTSAERDAGAWELGDMIYNSTIDAAQVYGLGGWSTL